MADRKLIFKFVEDFNWAKLEKCAPDEEISGQHFITRHGVFFFNWILFYVLPTKENERKGSAGFTLWSCGLPSGKLNTTYKFYGGDAQEALERFCVKYGGKCGDGDDHGSEVRLIRGPSVASLKEKDLVVDGGVKLGVKIVMKASDFDPPKWLALPSVTPDMNRVVRQLFDNLGTDNHRGTDFVIVVGDAKKELHLSSLALTNVPFFRRIFADAESKEAQEDVLQLPTHTVDAVREALRFIYLNEIGDALTRFLPSILSLASEWELKPLLTAIERDMIIKLQADQSNFDLAADYLHLADKYDRKVVSRVAICILMDTWPQFLHSPKGTNMAEELKDQVACVMAAAAISQGIFAVVDWDPLTALSVPSLTPNGGVCLSLFANLGTDDWRGTDFVITVGEAKTELHVYSLALTVVPFFDRMFGNNKWKENQVGVLHLLTHTVDAVIEALRFVYVNQVGDDLTRCLPSVLSLASEWELVDLMTYIERDMINKLTADRFHSDSELAAEYLQLADRYDRKVVGRLATRKLIINWPKFIDSPKGEQMKKELKDKVTIVMAEIANKGEVEG